MAELLLAEAIGPGDFRKVVAIKRLLPQNALDPQLLRMFLDEARLMARMSHPNIPQVYEVHDAGAGRDLPRADELRDGNVPASGADLDIQLDLGSRLPYFIMEYVHGVDLRAVLNEARGPLPLAEVLAVGAAMAAGLHYAHEMRAQNGEPLEVVHRDVSPSNVLVSFDGVVKITDFGVAKWNQQRSLTIQGQLKGKFAHMSPEQCQGRPLDRRSDVFALGTVLHEMAYGRPAFAADSDFELMSQIVTRDVRLPAGPGVDVPAPLAAIVLRTLRRSRDDRYPTAQAVQLDLERCARGHELAISAPGTAAYLETLFGARVSHWRAAMKSGQSLAEHLTDEVSAPAPPVADRTVTDGFVDHAWSGQVASRSRRARAARPRGPVFRRLGKAGVAVVGLAVVGVLVTLSSRGRPPAPPTAPRTGLGTGLGTGLRTGLRTELRPGLETTAESTAVAVAATTPAVVTTAPTTAMATAMAATATAGPATASDLRPRASTRAPARGRRRGTTTSHPSPPSPPTSVVGEIGASERAPPGFSSQGRPGPATDGTQPVIKVWDPDSPVPP